MRRAPRHSPGAAGGLGISALMVAGTSGVADHEQGLAARLLNSSLQVGGACRLAVVTAAIAPGMHLAMLYPGVGVILAFAVLTPLAQLIRDRRDALPRTSATARS